MAVGALGFVETDGFSALGSVLREIREGWAEEGLRPLPLAPEHTHLLFWPPVSCVTCPPLVSTYLQACDCDVSGNFSFLS